ncbi:MAG: hypothetical protein H8E15_14625 [Planctomycetes bacterium]|nr:hypothetical protein [Planctomycetota bacterium]
MNEAGTGASFREMSAWAQLIGNAGLYAAVVAITWSQPTDAVRFAWALGGALVFMVAILIVLHIVIALLTREQPDDERDGLIRLRSSRFSSFFLIVGILLAINCVLLQQITGGEPADRSFFMHPLFPAHLLLFSLMLSECLRLFTEAISYRRG